MTDTNQQTPLPTLRPGDSHMESLIDAAIHGHASTREAMRWLVRQLVPQPAQATQAEVTDAEIDAVTRQQWGEQLGVMFQAHRAYARAILALRPVQVPMTDEEIESLLVNWPKDGIAFFEFARAIEAHHGITAQAEKETP